VLLPTLPDGLRLDFSHPRVGTRERRDILLGRAERAEMRMVRRYVRADRDLVDLGASLGVIGARAVRRLAPGRQYVGVEMVPWAAEMAASNVSRHAPNGVRVSMVRAAICSRMKRVAIYDPGTLFNAGAMVGNEIPTTTLATVLESHAVADGYTLLMDIEGSEGDVLTNDRSALARCTDMIVELHDSKPTAANPWGCSIADALLALRALGFHARDARPPVYFLSR
jgi:FkbM family methyltransferase